MSLTGKSWRQGAADFLAGIADADALATALKNGTITPAQFANLANVPAGSTLLAQPYATGSFNLLTAAGTFQAFNSPTAAGKRFLLFGSPVLVMTARDAAFTGNLVAQLAQNGTAIAGATSSITSAAINTIATPIAQPQQASLPQGTNSVIDTSLHPLQINIVTAPTGPTVCTGYFVVNGVYL